MLSEPVTAPVDACAVTFNAASTRGSRLSESILAGMTTDTPMVIAVMASATIPKATGRLHATALAYLRLATGPNWPQWLGMTTWIASEPPRRPRESGDPVAFVQKTLASRFRGNDECGIAW